MPGAMVGLVTMAFAVQSPFVGELTPGHWVGERSRFYIHPITGALVWPVSVAEACAGCFVLLWLTGRESGLVVRLIAAMLGLGGIAMSVIGATRTYLFGLMAVGVLLGARLVIIRKRIAEVIGVFVVGTAIVWAVFGVESIGEALMTRLDRFATESVLDNSERAHMWDERTQLALETPILSGRSMERYLSEMDLSSHNQIIDSILIGGWLYAVMNIVGMAAIGVWSIAGVFEYRGRIDATYEACAVLMMLAVLQVSSPMISSHYAYAVWWYAAGMLLGRGFKVFG
ncbi:MAG: hypothetical protein KF833_16790, partial [Verrucomicrobiae bacterium]|nr:hypothetical protein [Verrucomicrobiae bacterium]